MANSSSAYYDMLDAVKRYYGTYDPNTGLWSGSDQWEEIAKYGIRPDNVDIVKQVPGIEIVSNYDGSYRSWNYNNPFSTSTVNIAEEINSNTQNGIYGTDNTFKAPVPVNTSVNASTGNYEMVSGSKNVSTGASVSTIARTVSIAIAAVTAGCRLGKFFAQETYNQNPNYWDDQLPTMNPETWSSIAGDNELGQKVMQFLFGIDPETDETTTYMDENALAYMAYSLNQLGAFNVGSTDYTYEVPESQMSVVGEFLQPVPTTITNRGFTHRLDYVNGYILMTDSPVIFINYIIGNTGNIRRGLLAISKNSFKYIQNWANTDTWIGTPNVDAVSEVTYNNTSFYYAYRGYSTGEQGVSNIPLYASITGPANDNVIIKAIATIVFDGVEHQESTIPGVSDQPDYTAPDTSTWTDPESTKQSLKQQYPEYWDGAIYNDVPQSDGTNKRYIYVPVPTTATTSKDEKQPTNTVITKNQTKVKPDSSTDDITNTITRYIIDSSSPAPEDVPTIPDNPVDNPPDTGDGDTPVVVTPTGNASALWSVYNPSQTQLDSFGSWLWSSDFFSQLKKLFNDPMQAIIGVHKVFASPQISGQSTIKCGYIDSEVPSNVVGSQYVTVNCGSVSLREYFGNVFDYAPYTEVKLFLPFIGVVPLDTAYVMRGSISITYHVDVITGACLAEVSIRRDSAGGIIYTFGGSCIVQYPVSSGSYMSVISGVLGTVASGVMAGVSIGTGNAIGAVYGISGAAQSVLNTHTTVQHSGGFTGCTGAMGVKKPYLIISRPQTELNGHEPHMSGLPSNDYITLSGRSGFIRCKHVHVTGIDNATATEKDEIERLLKQGVMI